MTITVDIPARAAVDSLPHLMAPDARSGPAALPPDLAWSMLPLSMAPLLARRFLPAT